MFVNIIFWTESIETEVIQLFMTKIINFVLILKIFALSIFFLSLTVYNAC